MNPLKKTWKLITSAIAGILATAGKDNPEAGVKVGHIPLKERFKKTTPFCAHCGMAFKEHRGGVLHLPEGDSDTIKRHIQQCPENPLVQRLAAAVEALRKIECRTNDLSLYHPSDSFALKKIHHIAQTAYRATQE